MIGRVRREADLEPVVQGKAEISKAAIICPYLKYPVTNAEALIRLQNDSIWVDVLEVAKRHHPLLTSTSNCTVAAQAA